MTVVRYCEPPQPPEGSQYCTLCLMNGKRQIADKYPDITGPASKLPTDGHDDAEKWLPWDKTIKLYFAVGMGITAEIPQLGVVPLCMSHLAFFRPRPVSPLQPAGQQDLPPGLIRGTG